MIIAMEGLIPGRPSPSVTQPTASPVEAQIHTAEWLRKQQHQPQVKTQAIPVPPGNPTRRQPGPRPGAFSQTGPPAGCGRAPFAF